MAEPGGRPGKDPPEEEDAGEGRGRDDRGGVGRSGAPKGFPWLTAGPSGKHTGIDGGHNSTPPRPPKTTNTNTTTTKHQTTTSKPITTTSTTTTKHQTTTSKPSKPGKFKPLYSLNTLGSSEPLKLKPGSSEPLQTLVSSEASKTNSGSSDPSKPSTPLKHNSKPMLTSTPVHGDPTKDTTIDLTGNPEDTIINPTHTTASTYLGHKRTTPDGFFLRPDGILCNKAGQTRVPTTEERLAWRILEPQAEEKLKTKENVQERQKRKVSQLSHSSTTEDTDEKRKKQNETTNEAEQKKTDDKDKAEVGYWNTDAVRISTVRIISSKGRKLTHNDLTHIGQYHMKACYHNFSTETDRWDEVAAERVSLVAPFTFAKFKIKTTKGIEFWKELIPQIPSMTDPESIGDYRILLPGEAMFEELFFSLVFAQLALGNEDDLKMLETSIRVNNPALKTVRFRLKSTGLDPVSQKTGIIMELLSSDRERCFGPKPADPSTAPKWKLRVGFSTINVTVAYGKAEKRRQD